MDRIKILITGATGYIGSSLNDAFKHTYEVFTISRNEVDLINSNKVNEYFADKYFDIVIHCGDYGLTGTMNES